MRRAEALFSWKTESFLPGNGGTMFCSIMSAALIGVSCIPVQVEADASNGLPAFTMVGFLATQVKEAQERVRTALKNTGVDLPAKRITVNLSPADIRKEGTSFDLPIAAALLVSFGYLSGEKTQGVCMAGELGLGGEVKPVRGILTIVDTAARNGSRLCIIPQENLKETEFIDSIPILGVKSLGEFIEHAKLEAWGAKKNQRKRWEESETEFEEDFLDVKGQETAKRAAVIAAAGFHNILFIGTKGSGKTMVASRLPTIFPGLSREESMEVSGIYSAAGYLPKGESIWRTRPFRTPHHTISANAMAGGGRFPAPGEITLAHRGILFLDELPEFSRRTLETLRQPLETHKICISRTGGKREFPADFLLAAAMNPCSCGYYPDRNRCACSQKEVSKYLGKISGPLLDRFDLCTEMLDLKEEELERKTSGKSSAKLRGQVKKAHEIQRERYREIGIQFNSRLTGKMAEFYCRPDREGERLLKSAYEKLGLSLRAYHKILKTARTIADLEEKEQIGEEHVGEAVFYRSLDKKYWG